VKKHKNVEKDANRIEIKKHNYLLPFFVQNYKLNCSTVGLVIRKLLLKDPALKGVAKKCKI
jgi:hypothetical protein